MIISSASVSSTISARETWFPPSNLSHSLSCDTISIAALTLTCTVLIARSKYTNWRNLFFKVVDLGIPGKFEAKPLHLAPRGN